MDLPHQLRRSYVNQLGYKLLIHNQEIIDTHQVFVRAPFMPINELRAIFTFAKAVELGSIRRAAVAQGVTPQAASQALAQLEEHLGVRLLHRTTRSLSLTDEGQRFLETTQPALAALDRALNQARASKDEIAGPLRIVGPKSSFAPILMSLIDEFCNLYAFI